MPPRRGNSHHKDRGTPPPQRSLRGSGQRGGRGHGAHHHNSSNHSGSSPRSPRPPRAPSGICDYYWQHGACNRGYECTFQHQTRNTSAIEPIANNAAETLDFFSPEGLAANTGTVRTSQQDMKPQEVHNHIKMLAKSRHGSGFTGMSASRVEGFSRIFGSVNRANPHWNMDSAQEFLDFVVQDDTENNDTLFLLGEVFRWSDVAIDAGVSTTGLSFQRGYFPLLQFFSSNLITRSAMFQNVHKLYTLVEGNYKWIHETVMKNVEKLIKAHSWVDPNRPDSQDTFSGVLLFEVLTAFFSEYFKLFKSAIRNHPEILQLVEAITDWFERWSDAVSSGAFQDPICNASPTVKKLTLEKLRGDTYRLQSIVRRESGVADEQRRQPNGNETARTDIHFHEALISRLEQTYVPPGDLRQDGPRHDNDMALIADIRIAPTHQELLCPIHSYLPCFVPNAPHHLPANTMQKHLDIQFRLLREELISTVRQSVNAVMLDIATIDSRPALSTRQSHKQLTQLETVQRNNGGAYRSSGADSVFFHVYTNVAFAPVKAERRSFSVGLLVDAPPGDARHEESKKRVEFWERSRRLANGNLVALMLISPGDTRVFLGTVTSFGSDVGESAKQNRYRIGLRVSFFDSEVALLSLRGETISGKASTYAILLDNSVVYESVHPFLSALQTVEPTSIPFGEIICSEGSLTGMRVSPPRYACVPGFRFNLQSLLPKTAPPLRLDVQDEQSIVHARSELERLSSLDPSQATAMVDALTRQICLIQGPPGTGKSYTGKEILRVLFDNKIKPIVLMAFTNHALDHMLLSVLDAKITSKLIRLGSRSNDERIAQYNLTKLEKEKGEVSALDTSRRREYRRMMEIEEEMDSLIETISIPQVRWDAIQKYLDIHHPHALFAFERPPTWITKLMKDIKQDEGLHGAWIEAGKKKEKDKMPTTPFGFWIQGRDLQFLQSKPSDPESDPRVQLFKSLNMSIPPCPNESKKRQLGVLLDDTALWAMAKAERRQVVAAWESDVRHLAYTSKLEEFESLREEYQQVCKNVANVHDQARQKILSSADLIGCTTTGAAKLVSLLTSVAPKVLVIEEAGQVLESHILASLVPSVEHLICIGDPEQLRPTLANYGLSMDSERGRRLFKFDRSLLERLSNNGWPMSLINVQRRMRPSISQFPRGILYPSLQDNRLVQQYPHVQGMQNDVFFMTHTHPENDEKDSVSKYNMFEVKLIVDLVLYFLKQGVYTRNGDIAVLCAYLGQLQKVRAALRDVMLAVTVDERDEEALERQGVIAEERFETVNVAKIIRLGTVDTFQGEEAKIVIVSLVRNSGDFSGDAVIGFLKSSNRINVALSRAKYGMYILGNSANLRQNKTWEKVLDIMEEQGLVGSELTIVCPRHPSQVCKISQPGQLSVIAPEGGCLARCEFQLGCGHTCQSVCHPDQDQHGRMKCHEPCQRISCPRGHPCPKECGDKCGRCEFPIYGVRLPCGHEKRISCFEYDSLDNVKCNTKVIKSLPGCEHAALIPCHKDPGSVSCRSVCGQELPCCGRSCTADCYGCQKLSVAEATTLPTRVTRVVHEPHPCQRLLYCQHQCNLACSRDHQCNDECQEKCWQVCSHRKCDKPCSEPCPPCMEPCSWHCEHEACPVPCGSICSRLPCDKPCRQTLKCGHVCPSVCGERCEIQQCLVCAPDDMKSAVVDFILQRTLQDLVPTSEETSERVITLTCGHTFTVETLDGHCRMADFYELDHTTGEYRGVKAPPINFLQPPVCPTCRGPITALRYGRVTKRAYLDILERNVASKMTKSLEKAGNLAQAANQDMEALEVAARALKSTPKTSEGNGKSFSSNKARKKGGPLPFKFLVKGFSSRVSKEWESIIQPLLEPYKLVEEVARMQGPHINTYNAALSTLYRLELDAIRSDHSRACEAPEPLAMAEVDKKIGQPPHKADTRYQVEAYFQSINLRFRVCQIAQCRIEALSSDSGSRLLWRDYVTFIYDSCIEDGESAMDMAAKSYATRQMARAVVLNLQSKFHRFLFSFLVKREDYARNGELNKLKIMAELVAEVDMAKDETIKGLNECERQYIHSRPCQNTAELSKERAWFEANCRDVMKKYLEESDELKRHILSNKGYQPLLQREKEDIVKALNFGYRGHFYNCQNGHTFVITDCGGAMETARCPECQAPIGGSDHTLLNSNTRAMEYEDIARGQGSLDPHWAWGQGA